MNCDVVDSQRPLQPTTTTMDDDEGDNDLDFDLDFDHKHGAPSTTIADADERSIRRSSEGSSP